MKRRDLLASLTGLAAASVGGCLSNTADGSPGAGGPGEGDGSTDTTTTPTTSDPTTTDPRTPDPPKTETTTDRTETPDGSDEIDGGTHWGPDTEEPFETIRVGDPEGVAFPDNNRPHTVRVWNGADSQRSLGLTLRADGETVVDRTIQFPADGWVRLPLGEPAAYELAIAVEGEAAGTVSIDRTRFDCNGSWTSVAVNAEGAVDSTTGSTMMACPGPEVAGESLTLRGGECGSGGEASVAFSDEAVEITGTVRAPNPCYDLALAPVELRGAEDHEDGTDDVLVVTVTTDGQKAEMCTDCIGAIGYEATVQFEHEYPNNVRVVHDSMDGARTVSEVSR